MKLTNSEFKRLKELETPVKAGKATDQEKDEYQKLLQKKLSGGKGSKNGNKGGKNPGTNDEEWWNYYKDLVNSTINIVFNHIPGNVERVDVGANTDQPLDLTSVARVVLANTIGQSTTDTDAFNVQMRALWLEMHRKYRGIGTYEKSDLGMFIQAIIEAYTTVAKMERIYGVLNTYDVMNRNIPYALFEALRIDSSIADNLANFRYKLNQRIEKMKQLCLPKGISMLNNKIVLYSNIFKDSTSARAALFLYDFDEGGVYNPTQFASGGSIIYYPFMTSGYTPSGIAAYTDTDLFDMLDTQIAALLGDDDIAKMCSDLIAAFEDNNITGIEYLPEDYQVRAVCDYERQLQFHNLTVVGGLATKCDSSVAPLTDLNNLRSASGAVRFIYQKNNVIYDTLVSYPGQTQAQVKAQAFVADGNGNSYNHAIMLATAAITSRSVLKWIFDTWTDTPGSKEFLCGTRFMSFIRQFDYASNSYYDVVAHGTEVCKSIVVINKYGSTTITREIDYSFNNAINATVMHGITSLRQLDWSPIFLEGATTKDIHGDIDNFTVVGYENMRHIHHVACLSGYKIPVVKVL